LGPIQPSGLPTLEAAELNNNILAAKYNAVVDETTGTIDVGIRL